MAKIWAERILAGTRIFEKVPASLKNAVKENLQARLGDVCKLLFD